MNKLEQSFYDRYNEVISNDNILDEFMGWNDVNNYTNFIYQIEPQYPLGIYKADFKCEGFIIEIDGHEYHKTKNQRYYDYNRERFFQKEGFQIIRFMGTEIFLNLDSCIKDVISIIGSHYGDLDWACIEAFNRGRESLNV